MTTTCAPVPPVLPIPTSCCVNEVPAVLQVTVSSPDCACTDGLTGELTYNVGTARWEGTITTTCEDHTDMVMHMTCEGSDCEGFRLVGEDPGPDTWCAFSELAEVGCGCDPFQLEFSASFGAPGPPGCGGATYTWTVTEPV